MLLSKETIFKFISYIWVIFKQFICMLLRCNNFWHSRELPHVDCVPSSELNQTVELYKLLVKLFPNPKGCEEEEHSMMSRSTVKI